MNGYGCRTTTPHCHVLGNPQKITHLGMAPQKIILSTDLLGDCVFHGRDNALDFFSILSRTT